MLRLLSKKETEASVTDFRAQLVEERNALISDVTELTKKKNAEILALEAAQKEHKERVDELESAFSQRTKELAQEVSSLETRKREALKPTLEREKQCAQRELACDQREQSINQLAAAVEHDRSEIVAKLADLTDRISEAKSAEERAEYRISKAIEAEEVNRKSTDALSIEWLKFRKAQSLSDETALYRESDLQRREAEILREKEWIQSEHKVIENERREIASLRATVQAAFAEGRRKRFIESE